MTYKCPNCYGALKYNAALDKMECEYCGSIQTVPTLDNEKKINLFTRANRLRSSCEFDKAAGVYESIVAEFQEEAEAYWGLILCKFGIEYVDDPKTGKKVPTCHRSSFDSVLDDPNFDMVMEYSDSISRAIYRDEAKAIEELRKGIIEVSAKEEPYDIFICYKETDPMGERTIDSVIAQDVYDALTEKGYKVFFSRLTLEDKLGQEYEPYIFAALNSAKVMLAFGTDYEYYNAVWVKNEWSRFLSLIEKGEKKTLIPCYKGIDAYDMPKEFARLQAQDMGKIGAIQDLVRGVGKILGPKTQDNKVIQTETIVSSGIMQTENLLKRMFIFLEDRNWESADEYSEKVLDLDPENAEAYLGKLMVNLKVIKREKLGEQDKTFDSNEYYQKVIRYGDEQLKGEVSGYDKVIKERINSRIYQEALEVSNQKNNRITELKRAIELLNTIIDYKDSKQLIEKYEKELEDEETKKVYQSAFELMKNADNEDKLDKAAKQFASIPNYLDSAKKVDECQQLKIELRYQNAVRKQNMFGILNLKDAINLFEQLGEYKDSKERVGQCKETIDRINNEKIYTDAIQLKKMNSIQSLNDAIKLFEKIPKYKDSNTKIEECRKKIDEMHKMDENSAKSYVKREKKKILRNIIIVVCILLTGYVIIKYLQYGRNSQLRDFRLSEVGDEVKFGTYNSSDGRYSRGLSWDILEISGTKYYIRLDAYETEHLLEGRLWNESNIGDALKDNVNFNNLERKVIIESGVIESEDYDGYKRVCPVLWVDISKVK